MNENTYLSQQFLGPSPTLDVYQAVVSIPNGPLAEGAQSQLDHRAVVQDLETINNNLKLSQ